MKRTLLLFSFLLISFAAFAQTALKGKVVDGDDGDESLPFAAVAIYKGGALVQGANTDIDGNYFFASIDPGTYDVVVTFTGYNTQKLEGVRVLAGKTNVADVTLSADGGVTLDDVVVVAYRVPLVEQDNTTQGRTVTSEEIRNLPTRSINAIAATSAGLASADEGGELSIRGSRSNATDYYVDGIRVQGNLIPESEIDQLQVITGGIESRYGDVSGGVISITTKGPSNKFSGGIDVETTAPMMDIGNNLIGLNINGPLIKKNGQSILGFRLAGRYTQRVDDDPSAVPVYRAKEDVLARLQANPVILSNGQPVIAAALLTNDDVDVVDFRQFEESKRYDLTGKLDARISDAIDVSLSGSYSNTNNQFTPNENANNSWALFNAQNNPFIVDNDYRMNFRFRHRLGGQGNDESGGLIQKASYILQLGYENNVQDLEDPIHQDNYFDYGYVGSFATEYQPAFDGFQDANGQIQLFHSGYNPVVTGYDRSVSANPTLSNYNNYVFEQRGLVEGESLEGTGLTLDGFPAINGDTRDIFSSTFNNHFQNIGGVYNLARKRDNDIYTFNASASFQIVPGSSDKSRHSIELGIMYEQRTTREWALNPRELWTTARLNANSHLSGQTPDTTAASIGTFTVPFNGQDREVNLYPTTTINQPENQFFRSVRELLGVPIYEFVNVDQIAPGDLSLDMFSAEELTNRRDVDYYGYDYLGNEYDGTFDDFFRIDPTTGRRSFNVAPNRPIYTAGYLQDKFTLNEMIFRIGVRVDRYDANTRVLKDPYSLYEIQGASDFHANNPGTSQPGNIGDEYAIYTTVANGDIPRAYRSGDQWFQADGTPVNSATEIEGVRSGLVFPKYANPAAHEVANLIKEDNFTVETSFKDYEVQFNVMPRLAFSFPISDNSNFFAHYDILVQRPPSNTIATALDYFYFVERTGNTTFNNPALRPERTVDYEVGFQQKLSNSSAIKISAYYKELRDMIQLRTYFPVPIVNQYTTYDNQDFGTTKGFSFSYDLRRTKNLQINANYTLQFADGTGSDANSQRGLTNRGNLRTLFPLNIDERHRLNLIMDYRLPGSFEGLSIFKDFGVNMQTVAVSGRPYTATFLPSEFGGTGTAGAINGARRPWNFTVNLRVDKNFEIGNKLNMNVYFRVSNLLDRRNIQNVYSATGSAEDSGFLRSSFGQDAINGFSSGQGAISAENYLASYQWRLLNPDFFSLPRRMYLGALLNF